MILALSITHRCNLSCRYCGGIERKYDGQKIKDISYEEICGLLEIGRKYRIKNLTITGGEPFVRKDIFRILEYGAELGYAISILSNGTLINKDKAKKLSQISHIEQVRVSMESPEKETFEYYRGNGAYEKVLTGLRNLHKYSVPTGIGFTVYPENVDIVERMVRFCVAEDIHLIRIVYGVSAYQARNLHFGKEFIQQILIRIINSMIKYNKYINLETINSPTPVEIISGKECPAGKYYFFVDSTGRMIPCPFIPEECKDIIRIEKVHSVDDFKNMKDYMLNLSDRIYHNLRGKCKNCELNKRCKGGCLAEKLTKGYKIYDEQPICIKNILEEVIKKFNHAKGVEDILDLWVYYTHLWKISEMSNVYCTRQLPIWTIPLNVGKFY